MPSWDLNPELANTPDDVLPASSNGSQLPLYFAFCATRVKDISNKTKISEKNECEEDIKFKRTSADDLNQRYLTDERKRI